MRLLFFIAEDIRSFFLLSALAISGLGKRLRRFPNPEMSSDNRCDQG